MSFDLLLDSVERTFPTFISFVGVTRKAELQQEDFCGSQTDILSQNRIFS